MSEDAPGEHPDPRGRVVRGLEVGAGCLLALAANVFFVGAPFLVALVTNSEAALTAALGVMITLPVTQLLWNLPLGLAAQKIGRSPIAAGIAAGVGLTVLLGGTCTVICGAGL